MKPGDLGVLICAATRYAPMLRQITGLSAHPQKHLSSWIMIPPAGLLWAMFSYLAPRLYQPAAVVEHLELEIIHWMVQCQKILCPKTKSVSYIPWVHPMVPISSHHIHIKPLNVFPYPHRTLGLLVTLIHFANSYSVSIPFIVHNIENGISHNAVNPTMNRSPITKKSCIKYPQFLSLLLQGCSQHPRYKRGKLGR